MMYANDDRFHRILYAVPVRGPLSETAYEMFAPHKRT